ncbi:NAD(P)H-dependent oxidoreductase [Actinomyces slackii]|uniref:NADPH-quinone reductase (Modulator of drug activity B) n=1 Tax=Actinomyces slackii TaxID=52774 RepID=A0A3S4U1D9_9ACTO|nr:NAD(P)H-dependent oxidoreductase [Actinomyces slackii]VEG74087.1 Putative NADPH-quinone reductase (modulator of drug activity B) [Actinomyces slackii]
MSRKSRRTLIIYAHPYEGSFNHAVLEAATASLDKARQPYDVIDLHADGFDPRYTDEELALFSEGGTLDPLVSKYQDLIDSATRLIVIAPIWWSELPGIVKGFVDKVMKQNWAYRATATGVKGRLTHIEEVLVLTTSTAPTWFLKRMAGNSVGSVFLGTIARQLGMSGRRWVNYGRVAKGGVSRRKKHLRRVARLARG